jgi:hypothetical protein
MFAVGRFAGWFSTGAVIPWDDTPPQPGEGVELIRIPFDGGEAPQVHVEAVVNIIGDANDMAPVVALFVDGECVAAGTNKANNSFLTAPIHLQAVQNVSGPCVVSVRVGVRQTSEKAWINGNSGGRRFGGAAPCILTVQAVWADAAAEPARDVYILAGQSNMSGRGSLTQVPAYAYRDRVKLFSNAGHLVPGQEPTDNEEGAVYAPINDAGAPKASLGMSFATRLVELRDRDVILVPCAKGGTAIGDWSRNLATTTCYGAMIARAKAAAAFGTIKGVLFYQGEGNTSSQYLSQQWPGAFAQFVADVRSDLCMPDLPFVFSVIGPNPGSGVTHWDALVSLQQSMTLPANVGRVTANDLTALVGDPMHIDTPSLVTLGRRFAEKIETLL